MQQDGARAAQSLRSDGRTAMGDLDGFVRERWRLLPLLVFGRSRLRPHCPCGHLCSRLPAHCGSAAVRDHPTAEQDLAHQYDRALMNNEALAAALPSVFGDRMDRVELAFGAVTATVAPESLVAVMRELRDRSEFAFEQLIDLCGVDYSAYGGTSRGVAYSNSDAMPAEPADSADSAERAARPSRFAVVYHLLS